MVKVLSSSLINIVSIIIRGWSSSSQLFKCEILAECGLLTGIQIANHINRGFWVNTAYWSGKSRTFIW